MQRTCSLLLPRIIPTLAFFFMKGGTYPFTYLGSSASDGVRTGPSKQDSLAYPDIQAYPTTLRVNSPFKFGPIQEIDDGGGTAYPESFAPLSSTLRGHEGVSRASIEDLTYTKLVDVDTPHDSRKDSISLLPVRRHADMREALERQYACDTCGKQYSQSQGVSRHRQAEHNPPSCLRCDFKWSRPYQYRTHLEKCHLDVNPDDVLGKPAGSHRRTKIVGRDRPQHLLPPAIQSGRPTEAEPRHCLPVPPMPTVAKATLVPSSAMLPQAYDLQPKHTEPARKYEDTHGLEFLAVTDAPSAFSSTEEYTQSAKNVGISIQQGQFSWLPPAPPSASVTDYLSSPGRPLDSHKHWAGPNWGY